MRSPNADLYKRVFLRSTNNSEVVTPKMYKGFSTVSAETENFNLYDFKLIQQDLLNHFYIRQGERLMNPSFGTIIWDMLFEPLTEEIKNLITRNVDEILNSDPRISASQVIVTAYESGIQIECELTYLPYNVSQKMQLKFDQTNGILAS